MLPGVLLHVIEPPGPVDPSMDGLSDGQHSVDGVRDGPVFILDHVDDWQPSERASVRRLPSRCRIESRPVEHDGCPPVVLRDARHRRVEIDAV